MRKVRRASKVLDNLTVNMGKMEMGHHKRASIHIDEAHAHQNKVLGFLSTTKVGRASRVKGKKGSSHLDTIHL